MTLLPQNEEFEISLGVERQPLPAVQARVAGFGERDITLYEPGINSLKVIDTTAFDNRVLSGAGSVTSSGRNYRFLDCDVDNTNRMLYLLLINSPFVATDRDLPRTQVWVAPYERGNIGAFRWVRDVERIDGFGNTGGGQIGVRYIAAEAGEFILSPGGLSARSADVYNARGSRLRSIRVNSDGKNLVGLSRVGRGSQDNTTIEWYPTEGIFVFDEDGPKSFSGISDSYSIGAEYNWFPFSDTAGDFFITIPERAWVAWDHEEVYALQINNDGSFTYRSWASVFLGSSNISVSILSTIQQQKGNQIDMFAAFGQQAEQGASIVQYPVVAKYVSTTTVPEFRIYGEDLDTVLSINPARRSVEIDINQEQLPDEFFINNDFVVFTYDGIDYRMRSMDHAGGDIMLRASFRF